MPSTPRCHEIPHSSIHSWRDTNWNPASPRSNSTSNQIDSAAGMIEASSPTSLTNSGRRRLISVTARAPNTGTSTKAVRIGKSVPI